MTIEEKFVKLVALVQKDIGALQSRIARLEAALSQRSMNGIEIQRGVPSDEETVAFHPVTGKGLKAKEVDPRLAMRLRFSEED